MTVSSQLQHHGQSRWSVTSSPPLFSQGSQVISIHKKLLYMPSRTCLASDALLIMLAMIWSEFRDKNLHKTTSGCISLKPLKVGREDMFFLLDGEMAAASFNCDNNCTCMHSQLGQQPLLTPQLPVLLLSLMFLYCFAVVELCVAISLASACWLLVVSFWLLLLCCCNCTWGFQLAS